MIKVSIDEEKCIGCGACAAICPENFTLDGGKAKTKSSSVEKMGCNQEASDSCPVKAITIKRE